jgi:hypothetical protein
MKIEGEHILAAPRDLVWQAVMDADVISRVLPGCEDMKPTSPNTFEGAMKIKVGPVEGKFQGSVVLTDLVPPESYHLEMSGKGPPGFVNGKGQIRLEADGATTKLCYQVDAQVGGRIASVGQRLLDSSARVITRQALEGLEKQILARVEAAAAGAAAVVVPEAPPPPSQAEFAAKVAQGVVADLVPPERRPLVYGIVGLVILAVILLLARSC